MKYYLDIHKLDDIKCGGWNGTTGIKSLSSEGLLLSSRNGWETYGWYVSDAVGKTVTFQIEYMNVVGNYKTYINNQESVAYAGQQEVTYSSNWTSASLTVNNALPYFTIMLRNEDNAGQTQSIRIRNVVILYEEKSTFEIKKNGITNAGIIEGYDEVKIERNNFRINPNLLVATYLQDHNQYAKIDTTKLFNGKPSMKISNTGATENVYYGYAQVLEGVSSGDIITASAWIYIPSDHGLDNGTEMRVYQQKTDGTTDWTGFAPNLSLCPKDKWFRIYKTYTLANNLNNAIFNFNVVRNGHYWFACPKVEFGDKITSWCFSESEGFEPIICENPVECNEIKEI